MTMDVELRQRFSVGGSAHDFGAQIPPLAAGRRVIAIDHRGHGRSGKSGEEHSYTIDHIVDDLAAWLPTIVDEPVHVLGHSMGGGIAMRFEFIRRDPIRRWASRSRRKRR